MSIPNSIQAAVVELVVALIIKANTGGDKAKEAARATEGLAIIAALQQIAAGNVPDGTTALQAAFSTAALDAGEALALQSLLSFASQQLSALQGLVGSTLAGQLETAVVTNVLAAAAKTCTAYLPKAA